MQGQQRGNSQVFGRADPETWRKHPTIEHEFAGQKVYNGLRQARYWGLAKLTIQVLGVCMVVNCTRMAKLQAIGLDPPGYGLYPAAGGRR